MITGRSVTTSPNERGGGSFFAAGAISPPPLAFRFLLIFPGERGPGERCFGEATLFPSGFGERGGFGDLGSRKDFGDLGPPVKGFGEAGVGVSLGDFGASSAWEELEAAESAICSLVFNLQN